MTVEVIDPVADYAELMEHLFDFGRLSKLLSSGRFRMRFDAMHAITGPYAHDIFEKRLGAPTGTVMNGTPLPDFGGGHPDPNLVYAHDLVAIMNGPDAPDFGAASDGDGDRNMILGRNVFVSPSDSLAMLAANAQLIPGYAEGLAGVARSMPTSRAVDCVAAELKIPCFETPTGWKYFGNLLDADGSPYAAKRVSARVRTMCAKRTASGRCCSGSICSRAGRESVEAMVKAIGAAFGRNYYTRHDYEGLDTAVANALIDDSAQKASRLRAVLWARSRSPMATIFLIPIRWTEAWRNIRESELSSPTVRRIVYRLSGTGTSGATLRVYLERYEPDPSRHDHDVQEELRELAPLPGRLRGSRKKPDAKALRS